MTKATPIIFLGLGALFGFLLTRAGATDPQLIADLFLFRDFHLMIVITAAIATGTLGIQLLRRLQARSLTDARPIQFKPKAFRPGLVAGALIFGIGWGLTGSCPGTATTMIGEGKLFAAFTVAGILIGTLAYGVAKSRRDQSAKRSAP